MIALVLAPSELLFGALAVIGLKTGVMQGRGGYSARRSEAPAVFWLIWALNLGLLAASLFLAIRSQ